MRLFLIALIILVAANDVIAAGKNVLRTGESAHIIGKSTSCKPTKWGNNVVNSCLCCLVKHMPAGTMDISAADQTLKGCAKYCNENTLSTIARRLNVRLTDSANFMHAVRQENSGLHHIEMQPRELSPTGDLNASSAVTLLERAGIRGNLSSKTLGGGGAQTLQLFLIKVDGEPRYILKGMKEAFREVANNEIIRTSPLKSYLLSAHPQRGRPAIALDIDNFVYMFQGKQRYFALLNLAPGTEIAKIIMNWRDAAPGQLKSVAEEKVARSMKSFGSGIGKIHVEFMNPQGAILGNTAVHGDMHPYNVFYDKANDRVVFIDNETFAISLQKPQDATIDIMKLMTRLVAVKSERHAYKRDMDEHEFYRVVVRPFVEGYIDAYGVHAPQAFQKLFDVMTGQGVVKTWLKSNKSAANILMLYKTQQLYAKKMFEDIAQTRGYAIKGKTQQSRKSRLLFGRRPAAQ